MRNPVNNRKGVHAGRIFTMTDHACRVCGGRVLQWTNCGPTGGGNPMFMCADCEAASSGFGPGVICWCGFTYRGQMDEPYQCSRMDAGDDNPSIRQALAMNGCTSKSRGAIGVLCTATVKRLEEKNSGQ